jgi:hypothetical protein
MIVLASLQSRSVFYLLVFVRHLVVKKVMIVLLRDLTVT